MFKTLFCHQKKFTNKNLIRGYLNKIITSGVSAIDKNLDEAFINDVKINSFYPINEFEGLKNLKEKIFENIWIQPAAGDAGGSLGAALAYWHRDLKNQEMITKIK